jgi:DNA methylase
VAGRLLRLWRPVPTGLESASESESEKTSSQPGTRFSASTHGDERAHPHALSPQSRTPYELTLRNAQITRGTADRWQRAAGVPDHAFEAYIAETRARAWRLTTRDVMRLAPPPTRLRPEPVNLGTLDGMVPWTIEQGDAARLPLADGTVQLIVTSPPYGLGKDYDVHDEDQSYAQYLELARTWAAEMFRVSRPQSRLCLNVPLDISRRRPASVRRLAGTADGRRLDLPDHHRLVGVTARQRAQLHRTREHRLAVGSIYDRPDRDHHRVLQRRVEPAPFGCVRSQPRGVAGLDQWRVDLRRRAALTSQAPGTIS